MRGEDMANAKEVYTKLGSPPHARGRLLTQGQLRVNGGSPPHARGRRTSAPRSSAQPRITPACAGKTAPDSAPGGWGRDHPRMRGEDHPVKADAHVFNRITPACAGKTGEAASS